MADLHSKILDARPPGPNSFNFMQFLGKFGKFVCWHLPLESWRPHLGEILDPPLHSVSPVKAILPQIQKVCKKHRFTSDTTKNNNEHALGMVSENFLDVATMFL